MILEDCLEYYPSNIVLLLFLGVRLMVTMSSTHFFKKINYHRSRIATDIYLNPRTSRSYNTSSSYLARDKKMTLTQVTSGTEILPTSNCTTAQYGLDYSCARRMMVLYTPPWPSGTNLTNDTLCTAARLYKELWNGEKRQAQKQGRNKKITIAQYRLDNLENKHLGIEKAVTYNSIIEDGKTGDKNRAEDEKNVVGKINNIDNARRYKEMNTNKIKVKNRLKQSGEDTQDNIKIISMLGITENVRQHEVFDNNDLFNTKLATQRHSKPQGRTANVYLRNIKLFPRGFN